MAQLERLTQNYEQFVKALNTLEDAIDLEKSFSGNERLQKALVDSVIQRFEYTYEMAWNVMKDYALYQGNSEIAGSRDAIRYAFSTNLIKNGEMWMDMMKSRIKTSHTYNEETANEIYVKIINEYYDVFKEFENVMEGKRTGSQQSFF